MATEQTTPVASTRGSGTGPAQLANARNAPQALKTKEYETIYILRSDVDADAAEKVQNRVAEVIAREGGRLLKVEAWGRRRLAYPVAKNKKGVYVYVKFVGKGGLVAEIERNLKLSDTVLKFQTVLTNEEIADAGAITVDPEEIKWNRLELPAEEDEKESREKALGLIDLGPDAPRAPRREEDEFADDVEEEAAPKSVTAPEETES